MHGEIPLSELLALSIAEIATSLRRRDFSATELATAAIEQHERHDEKLRAYRLFDAESALAGARAADTALAAGSGASPLCGIPVSIKDLYGVDGWSTFAGTPRQLPEKWSRDAWLVERMRSAGAVIVGKTHMVEMAFGGVGMNPHWGTPWNPWDASTHRVPGGSSSGAGVSLWEGSSLLALGSDTGGSIRIPAAMTGVVGARTTHGRWPTTGVVPLSSTLDTVGALARTVEDYVCFFASVDPRRGDPHTLLEELDPAALDGLRIALPVGGIWDDCQTDIAHELHRALGELESAAVEMTSVEGADLDRGFELSMGVRPIAATECRHFLETELPGWFEILDPMIARRLENAPAPDDERYTAAIEEHNRLAAAADQLFESADVLALPANMITPPPVAELRDLDRYAEANAAILRPTYPVSVLGLCGISIPVGLDASGMPVGLQLVAPGGDDERLLAVALAAERVLGTAKERIGEPPLLAPDPNGPA